MKFLQYFFLCLLILFPTQIYAGIITVTQSFIDVMINHRPDEDVYAYYDLRNRKTYIQVTNIETQDSDALPTLCLHIQIFQQDQGCSELNFEDELTPNDTVIYDMDNIIRNNGTDVPINLDDDSYGYVAISAYECGDRSEDSLSNPLLGNFRIIDDSGYEYRTNLINDRGSVIANLPGLEGGGAPVEFDGSELGHFIIPFNTVDGAKYADIVGFVAEENRTLSGVENGETDDLVYNEDLGVTFDVFQIDENEEVLSCDRKTIGCGPAINMNYGINEDYPNSRSGPLLCEGAGLLEGQTNGYISLQNPTLLSPVNQLFDGIFPDDFEFICLAGFNNGNGTGSMDICNFKCNDPGQDDDILDTYCRFNPF